MRDFMAEESPCFALGLVEERKQPCGFLALRPAEVIPPEISGLGFNFGHALLGTTEFEVIQFVFHFYGFETYNMLVNPNNRLVKKVLTRMVESGDYFFFAISPNQSVTAFRSEIGQKNLAGLSTNLRQIQGSTTTDAQYQRALAQFRMKGSASAKRFFTHFCSGCSLQGLSSGRIVAIQTEFCTFDSCKMEGSGDSVSKLC
jgi:hypothetical protein